MGFDTIKRAEELIETDREFSKVSVEKGLTEAFYLFAAEDATMLPEDSNPVIGKGAVKEHLSGSKTKLEWEPVEAKAEGSLGYTWGKYVATSKDKDGNEQYSYGKYVTIWKRQNDGNWKWIVDIGNQSPYPNDKYSNIV